METKRAMQPYPAELRERAVRMVRSRFRLQRVSGSTDRIAETLARLNESYEPRTPTPEGCTTPI